MHLLSTMPIFQPAVIRRKQLVGSETSAILKPLSAGKSNLYEIPEGDAMRLKNSELISKQHSFTNCRGAKDAGNATCLLYTSDAADE